jgi:glycosyltransferase involved in cell wall biosynthesis
MRAYDDFCVLIPTRNRRGEVESLLSSIEAGSVKPSQVVLVSSGEDISDSVDKFKGKLDITYIHSEIAGQINQKRLGLSRINPLMKWVVFLDDDLLVLRDTFERAFECIHQAEGESEKRLAGVGFGLPATTRFNNQGKLSKIFAGIFGINNFPPGSVLSNGHATSYLEQQEASETKWLNGASMWRIEEISNYGSHGISSKYAACEDLIFSYPIGKKKPLLYCPSARIDFQLNEKTDFENPSVYIAALYWRYFFILQHKELSILKFNFTQIGRLLFGIKQNKGRRMKFIFVGIPANYRVAKDSFFKRDPRKFLESI